ncbi:MAG: hypothetical protein MUF23_02710 [Pirellula sp.]|nr:hypothetical protein [Pirellula sp.]
MHSTCAMVYSQAPSDEPPNEPSREAILEWIQDLGSSEFAVRDRATRQLNALSTDHLPLLVERLEPVTDPEVRVRLSGVVAKLKFERQQNIVRAFLRDPDMNQTHELDGWATFAAVAGPIRSSKRLFLELLDRHPQLVEKPLETAQQAYEAAVAVSRQIQESEIQLGEGEPSDGLALLYCLCTMNAHGDSKLAASGLRVFGRFPYNQLIRDPQSKRPMETLVERWAVSLQAPSDLTSAMLIMIESDLSTVRSVAQKMLRNRQGPERADPEDLLIGLQVMFRSGTVEDLPLLESWLDCTDVCYELEALSMPARPLGIPSGSPPGGIPPLEATSGRRTVEVRDAAILACMRITGMEYRNYFPGIRTQEPRGYMPNSILLLPTDQEVRQARIDAWRASRQP